MDAARGETVNIGALARMTVNRLTRRHETQRWGIETSDLVSLTYLAGIRAVERYRPERGAGLRSWVLAWMRGAVMEQLGRAGRDSNVWHGSDVLGFEVDGAERDLPDCGPGPEEVAIKEDRFVRLRRGVERLERRRREVIRLRYWGELTYRQIGERLGVGECRAFQLHAEAIERLRAWMGE